MGTIAAWSDRAVKLMQHAEQRIVYRIIRDLVASDQIRVAWGLNAPPDTHCDELISLRLPDLYWATRILLKPDLMLGQTYVDGHWSVQPERLYDFLNLIRSHDNSGLRVWFLLSNRLHLIRDTFKQQVFPLRSTRAVVEHYNTDPVFMRFILGDSYSYTCAFFESEGASLEAAQSVKLKKIVERADIHRDHRVLDLGTGWGYAPFPLAEEYECNVTGITISPPQVDFCNERKKLSRAANRLDFVCADYVSYEVAEKFDRVISTGMLEHVGKFQYSKFFDRVAYYLATDGVALIHSMITERETSTDAWIDKHIFPGGYIPTAHEVVTGIEDSDCELQQLFTQPASYYFRTLELWKRNLLGNRGQCLARLSELGLSSGDASRIVRIWEYFLSGSQIGFSGHNNFRTAHFVVKRKPR